MTSNIIGSTTAYPYLVINASGGNISRLWLNGNGSSAGSNKLSDSYIVGGVNWNSSNNAFFTQTNFMNYSNLNIFKTFLTEVGNSSVGVEVVVNTLRSLDPITSIQYVSSSGNLNSGSALSLWGVK